MTRRRSHPKLLLYYASLWYNMTEKSTWWSITVYGDEIARVEDPTQFPEWVAKMYGGREECPTTKRLHFQGALQCHGQQRFGKIKGWLPTAHIERAVAVEALKKYVMKSQTAIGEKTIVQTPKKFLNAQGICMLIASKVIDRQADRQNQFWKAVEELIVEDPGMTGQLMNPSLKNFWVNTAKAWDRLQQLERDSITHAQSDISDGCIDPNCCKWHDADNHRDECYRCEKCDPTLYASTPEEESVSQESGTETESGSEEGPCQAKGPPAPGRR